VQVSTVRLLLGLSDSGRGGCGFDDGILCLWEVEGDGGGLAGFALSVLAGLGGAPDLSKEVLERLANLRVFLRL
jgi:hypothetical protein